MFAILLMQFFAIDLDAAAKARDLPRVERMVREEYDDVSHVSTAEAAKNAQAYVWIDTREAKEYAVSHVPGAVRVDPDLKGKALANALAALPKDKPILAYCSVGVRSSTIARRIQAMSKRPVYNLEGGIFQWTIDGRPLVDANGRKAMRAHGFDGKWGQLLPDDKRAP